jgi:hypothetical protein
MHKTINLNEGTVGLSAFSVSEYNMRPQQPPSAVSPMRTTEKVITFSGTFERGGQTAELTLRRKISKDEIARALARINLLNEFFSDLGQRFESGVEAVIPLFDGLRVGFRKIDFKTTGTVFIFEQGEARGEFVSATVGEMTDLRDGLGHMLNV